MEGHLNREMLESLVEAQTKIDKLDLSPMLEFLIKQIIDILKIERVSIFDVLSELEEFRLLVGEPKEKHGVGKRFRFDELNALKEVIETKSWSQIKDPLSDKRTENSKDLIYFEGITALLIIPLLLQNEVRWLIVIDAKGERKEFCEGEIYFCLALANLAGLLLERDLMQKEKAERETLIMLGQAAAEAAHRLRNPVDFVAGYAKRLLKLEAPLQEARYKDYAGRIVDGVMELEKIVNDLLRLSRQKRTKLLEININEAVIETKKLFEPISEKDIKVDFKLDPGLPVILGDPLDMEELFSVIFRNAAEAIQKEGKIFVKTKYKDGWIKISISNTGGCIDKEAMQEIFNPFFSTKPDATGMGLATAMAIIRAYDGEIRVENDKSLNLTTFIVKLPTDLTAERG